jgi:hypothetical protein
MICLALPLLLLQSPPPPRDAPAPKTGTAAIRGQVIAADTNLPLRGVVVTVSGPALGEPGRRAVATDAQGRFSVTALPAGAYRVHGSPGAFRGQYLGLQYGARRNGELGDRIELADGQRFDGANIALPRGGTISGRVVDEFGEVVTRVSVFVSRMRPGGVAFHRGGMPTYTDDRGQFRLYGLEPAEYIVGAEARGSSWPAPDGPSEGYMTTYHPSSLVEREATRVRVAAAQDVADIEIRLVRTRTFRISLTVMDSQGRPVSNAHPNLYNSSYGGSGGSSSSNEPGKFTIRDVVPGDYRLVVQPFSGIHGETADRRRPEYAEVPLTVNSDIDDLVVVTQPGTTIRGEVVFAEGAPAVPPSGLQVMVQPSDRTSPALAPTPSVTVGTDLQFTFRDIWGSFYVRSVMRSPTYTLKAVMLGDTDISDTAVRFTPEHDGKLRVVLTSRSSVVEGVVRDEKGEPVGSATVVMFPEEKSSWRSGSLRLRFAMTGKDGKFALRGVLAGRYYAAAVQQGEQVYLGAEAGPEAFEAVTKDAVLVSVGEDEKRALDLQVGRRAQQ